MRPLRSVRERANVYRFTVRLLEVSPPVWRTIEVPAAYSFWDLHVALQDAMGWRDYHGEHESILQWLGGAFDPERFDPRRVRYDDPAHRYELAFGKPMRRRRRARTPRR
jgi:hypothetical protein